MKKVIIIVGPTAVGKTELAVDIAEKINGEIVSADSMQIYKHMDIGSAKPSESEKRGITHYLIDEIEPDSTFSVSDYQRLAKAYIHQIVKKGKTPIVAGGTGLYVNSLLYDMDFSAMPSDDNLRKKLEEQAAEYGNTFVHNKLKELDPSAAERIHPNNLKRVIRAIEVFHQKGHGIKKFEESFKENKDYKYILIGLFRNRVELYERINKRVDMLMDTGLLSEVENLVASGLTEKNISMKGIGYKELIGYLNGEYILDRAVWLIKRNTRRYAKRQMTWFRGNPDIKWYNLSNYSFKEDIINDILLYINQNHNAKGKGE